MKTLARDLEAAQANGALSVLARRLDALLSQHPEQARAANAAEWEAMIVQTVKAMVDYSTR